MLKFPAAGAQHPRQGLSISDGRPSIVRLPARIEQAGFVPVLLQLAFPMCLLYPRGMHFLILSGSAKKYFLGPRQRRERSFPPPQGLCSMGRDSS